MLRRGLVASCIVTALLLTGCASTSERMSQSKLKKAATFNAQLGAGYLARGRLEQAKVKFEKALQQDPNNPEANSGYALLQARLGRPEEAERYFERAIELDPEDSEVMNNYGAYLCDQGKREEAERYFMLAARNPLYRTPEFAYRNAGTCAMKSGDFDAAEEYYERAVEANPKFAPALLDLVRVSQAHGRYQAAVSYLDRYHNLFPQSPESLFLAVNLYRDLGNGVIAGSYANRLTTLFPDSAQAQRLREQTN